MQPQQTGYMQVRPLSPHHALASPPLRELGEELMGREKQPQRTGFVPQQGYQVRPTLRGAWEYGMGSLTPNLSSSSSLARSSPSLALRVLAIVWTAINSNPSPLASADKEG